MLDGKWSVRTSACVDVKPCVDVKSGEPEVRLCWCYYLEAYMKRNNR